MNKFERVTETHGAGESLFSSTGGKGYIFGGLVSQSFKSKFCNPRTDYDPVALAIDGVDSFYEEVDDYYGSLNYFTNEPKDKRDDSRRIYHFSSVVWRDTLKLGIGIAKFTGYPAQSEK